LRSLASITSVPRRPKATNAWRARRRSGWT
jgi:hypothetical protein